MCFYAHGKLPCFSSLIAGSSDEDSSFIFSIPASFLELSSSPPFSFPHLAFGEDGMVSDASFDLESAVSPSDGSGFSLGAVSCSVSFRIEKQKISHCATSMHRYPKPCVRPGLLYLLSQFLTHLPL